MIQRPPRSNRTVTLCPDTSFFQARLDALGPALEKQREEPKAAREAKLAEARAAKARIVETAEKLAAGSDWRNGADKLRALLEEWKALADRKSTRLNCSH